jgi:hypothetical protein
MSWGTHLREFYGRLVYRRVVPKDVRPHIGKTEWTKVLGATSLCRSERSRLEKFEDVRFETAVAAARQKARQAVMEAIAPIGWFQWWKPFSSFLKPLLWWFTSLR